MPLTIAHFSDLHVSTFGDTFHDSLKLVRRSGTPFDASSHEAVWAEAGWRILREKGGKKHRIVDPEGFAHKLPSVRQAGGHVDPIGRGAQKACRLAARRAAALAAEMPSPHAVETMLRTTPRNTNLRFLKAVFEMRKRMPDVVVITGDLTDNGDGFELIEKAFEDVASQGRLLVVPGNHDLYLFPFAGSTRPKPTAEGKRLRWEAFQRRAGIEPHPSGAWSRRLGDVAFVGLNSCVKPQRRFFLHNGAIGPEQLTFLRAHGETREWSTAKHRVVLLHHHVVRLAHHTSKSPASDFTLRLDDARHLLTALEDVGATLVMHGHKHLSEERIPIGCNFRLLASASTTLGCRSGAEASYWHLELGDHVHIERVRVRLDALSHEAPQASEP